MSLWVINEAIAVIDSKRKSKEEKDVLISSILKAVADVKSNIRIVRVEPNIVENSIHYIRKYRLSANDALHACVADIAGCDYLLTADEDFKHEAGRWTRLQIVYMGNEQEVAGFLKNL